MQKQCHEFLPVEVGVKNRREPQKTLQFSCTHLE
uniref:Uncharacterized protein n=1 Tax=Arundo donax TaxID=35708 RepID=A0A0A9GAY4_ARUDO